MDFITLLANIAQILSFLWLVSLGSKTVFDLAVKHRKIRPSPLLIMNIILTLVILFLSSALPSLLSLQHSKTSKTSVNPTIVTTRPTGFLESFPVLYKPELPITIPCSLGCDSKLVVVLNKVAYEPEGSAVVLTFALTNEGAIECNMTVKELKIVDPAGHIWDASGQIRVVGSISPKQRVEAVAFFYSLQVSRDGYPYSLHMVLACHNTEAMIYLTEQFSFIGSAFNLISYNNTVDETLLLICNGISIGDYHRVHELFTADLQERVSEGDIGITFGEAASCDYSAIHQSRSTATDTITFTTFAHKLNRYEFYLSYGDNVWKVSDYYQLS